MAGSTTFSWWLLNMTALLRIHVFLLDPFVGSLLLSFFNKYRRIIEQLHVSIDSGWNINIYFLLKKNICWSAAAVLFLQHTSRATRELRRKYSLMNYRPVTPDVLSVAIYTFYFLKSGDITPCFTQHARIKAQPKLLAWRQNTDQFDGNRLIMQKTVDEQSASPLFDVCFLFW